MWAGKIADRMSHNTLEKCQGRRETENTTPGVELKGRILCAKMNSRLNLIGEHGNERVFF